MADRPARGLADVVAASTALSDIDGKAGRLSYRGYDIHELAGQACFEEVVHLLHYGELPTRRQLDALRARLAEGRAVGPTVGHLLPLVAERAEPMEALRTLVSAASLDDPDRGCRPAGADLEANRRKAGRLVALTPVLVAAYHAARTGGGEPPDPDPALGVAGNLLLQLTGAAPDERAVAVLDECLVLHADHTMNASTFAARVCAATLSDMHSAVTAAIATLKGPLHGGANEQVMRTLESIDSVDAVAGAVDDRLSRGEKLMGFGHRVYRTEDPRATHLRELSRQLAERTGERRWYEMSVAMEKVVMDRKGLYPNVDFFAASVYRALGIPTDLFTPVFAVSRMAGWTGHVMEQQLDNRLIRPDSEYVGPGPRGFVPLDRR